ncbi:MAG: GGDEF domain-containing protein [Gemmatimonadaceae bacterium]
MPTEQVNGLIQFIGLVSQLGGAMLLVTLFAVLRAHALHRDYFLAWGRAWLALAVALAATATRYAILPTFDARLLNADFDSVRPAYYLYQFAKLLYFTLLVLGTAAYVTGARSRRLMLGGVGAAAVYALSSVAGSTTLRNVVVWQIPVAVVSLVWCSHALLALPRSRRSVGNRVTGTLFGAIAAMWMLYLVAFNYETLAEGTLLRIALERVVRYNGYVDLLLQMLLGYGMVVMLMEDAKREVTDAHAELAVAHDRLRRVSLYDSLTGSLNRRAFDEGVGLESARHTFGSVVVLDTDNLKMVNDGFGHRVGDVMLQQIAAALRGALQPADRLYRWGGDEFLVVFPGTRAADAQARLEAALAACGPLRAEGVTSVIEILVSVGAADYGGGEELTAAIERADERMYDQKARRRIERSGVTPPTGLTVVGQRDAAPSVPGGTRRG